MSKSFEKDIQDYLGLSAGQVLLFHAYVRGMLYEYQSDDESYLKGVYELFQNNGL